MVEAHAVPSLSAKARRTARDDIGTVRFYTLKERDERKKRDTGPAEADVGAIDRQKVEAHRIRRK